MALQIETIRATADRIAASLHLDVVELEFTGGAKHRTLRIFLEKDAEARAQFAAKAAASAEAAEADPNADLEPDEAPLPKGVPVEMLSFVTHEDCATFATDFGTVLDIEDLIPGAEYTLEVSSPGLERKLFKAADYERFTGSLVKLQTFSAIDNNRHFTGRLTAANEKTITLDLSVLKQKGKQKKTSTEQTVTIPLANVEKANLVAEI
jgi:ribosome maturation factor RimP